MQQCTCTSSHHGNHPGKPCDKAATTNDEYCQECHDKAAKEHADTDPLTASITDPDAVEGAAGGLMRQARLLERTMRRDTQLRLSTTVGADWQQFASRACSDQRNDANPDGD